MGFLNINENRAERAFFCTKGKSTEGRGSCGKPFWQNKARALKQFKRLGLVNVLQKNNNEK